MYSDYKDRELIHTGMQKTTNRMKCPSRILNSRGVFNKVGAREFSPKIVVGRRDFVSTRSAELTSATLCSVYHIMAR